MPSLKQIGHDGQAAAPPAADASRPVIDSHPSSDPSRPSTHPVGGRPDADAEGPAGRTMTTAGVPAKTRLVVLRPDISSGGATQDDGDADGQWPMRRRHERAYRLAVRVETLLARLPCSSLPGGAESGGGRMVLRNEDGTETAFVASGERLTVVRPGGECTSSAGATDAAPVELHPSLAEGDVITTLDGVPSPTYGDMYRMMCRGEKLVLEEDATSAGIIPTGRGGVLLGR